MGSSGGMPERSCQNPPAPAHKQEHRPKETLAMADRMLDLMLKLDAARGISGYEEEVAELMHAELAPLSDEQTSDPLGNHYFTRRGPDGAPVLMLCAHMDELGFLVQHIEDEGFLRLAPVGFHDDRMLTDQVLEVDGAKGSVFGVVGTKPAHIVTAEERAKAIPLHEMFLDLGTSSREESEALGVRVGDPVTFVRTGMPLNGTRVFTGKAVDDRAGCAVMIETMRRLSEREVPATVVAVASVQEEVGLRGAGPAAFRVKPDIAIALDVTLAGDTPATEFRQLPIRLGGGPAIKYFDWAPAATIGSAVPRRLTKRMEEAAARAKVPFQREVLLGGATDAGSIALAGAGTLTGCVSIPSRHIHSAVGVVHLGDMEQCVDLLLSFAELLPLE
jgi:putative aminopeptidase FrvX